MSVFNVWEKCTVGEYNLGAKFLTSKKTKAAYCQYLQNNLDFCKEIEDKIGNALQIDEEVLQVTMQIEAEAVAAIDPKDDLLVGPADDTDVPLQCIIKDSLGLDLPRAVLPRTETFCVLADAVVEGNGGMLQGGGDAENIWAYSDNGTPWRTGNFVQQTSAEL
ncbi:hypothetical protein B0H10DRAFT_1940751 [Mycena sp. CBHHK59/15]|nr:hypothetical protein B0H10DRAFT_1970313 [Mycena sp. CBHHK59/15]KAJ6628206.1 hypothetical protein B0H10DRAFT_1940751 [Mycena sp. CBHHK59/15]